MAYLLEGVHVTCTMNTETDASAEIEHQTDHVGRKFLYQEELGKVLQLYGLEHWIEEFIVDQSKCGGDTSTNVTSTSMSSDLEATPEENQKYKLFFPESIQHSLMDAIDVKIHTEDDLLRKLWCDTIDNPENYAKSILTSQSTVDHILSAFSCVPSRAPSDENSQASTAEIFGSDPYELQKEANNKKKKYSDTIPPPTQLSPRISSARQATKLNFAPASKPLLSLRIKMTSSRNSLSSDSESQAPKTPPNMIIK